MPGTVSSRATTASISACVAWGVITTITGAAYCGASSQRAQAATRTASSKSAPSRRASAIAVDSDWWPRGDPMTYSSLLMTLLQEVVAYAISVATTIIRYSMKLQKPQLDAWRALLRGQALLIEEVERELAAAGLPPLGWYDVLTELDKAGGPLRIPELAHAG